MALFNQMLIAWVYTFDWYSRMEPSGSLCFDKLFGFGVASEHSESQLVGSGTKYEG